MSTSTETSLTLISNREWLDMSDYEKYKYLTQRGEVEVYKDNYGKYRARFHNAPLGWGFDNPADAIAQGKRCMAELIEILEKQLQLEMDI